MKHLVGLVVVSIIALLGTLYFKLGGYKDVAVSQTEAGPFKVVSKRHSGAYHKIVPVIEEVEKWARANGEPCKLSFGEYIDDPELVEEDRMQSNGGCVVEKEWTQGLPEGFTYRALPKRRFVFAEFDGAPSIGPLKVYPRAKDFIASSGLTLDGPVIEMYDIVSEKSVVTKYYFPVK